MEMHPQVVVVSVIIIARACSVVIACSGLTGFGTEFVLSFAPNKDLSYANTLMRLMLVSTKACQASVEEPGRSSVPYNLLSYSRMNVDLNVTAVRFPPGFRKEQKGIRVNSTEPISLYAYNGELNSNDGLMVYPTSVSGPRYIVISFEDGRVVADPLESGVLAHVVAAEPINVSVKLVLPNNLPVIFEAVAYNHGAWINTTLNTLEVLQIYTEDQDITGTEIFVSGSVFVMSGAQCQRVPDISGYRGGDHLVEPLLPVKHWGNEYLTVPLSFHSAGDIFRIVTSDPSNATSIKLEYSAVNSLRYSRTAITFRDHDRQSTDYIHIHATRKIMVVQFAKSRSFDNSTEDPFMKNVPPINHFKNSSYCAYFSTVDYPASAPAPEHFASVIVGSLDSSFVLLNKATVVPVTGTWSVVPHTSFVGGNIQVPQGFNEICITGGSTNFSVTLHGTNKIKEDYGYTVAYAIPHVSPTTTSSPASATTSQITSVSTSVTTSAPPSKTTTGPTSVLTSAHTSQSTSAETSIAALAPTSRTTSETTSIPTSAITSPPTSVITSVAGTVTTSKTTLISTSTTEIPELESSAFPMVAGITGIIISVAFLMCCVAADIPNLRNSLVFARENIRHYCARRSNKRKKKKQKKTESLVVRFVARIQPEL